jgi:transposase
MAAKPIKMEQLKLILSLHQKGYSKKHIARQTGIARNTVKKYIANQYDDKPLDLKKEKLVSISFNDDTTEFISSRYERLIEYFKKVEGQLKLIGVTSQLLWHEYKQADPEGYCYSQYCHHFNEYIRHKEVVMHLEHKAGESTMIDFAGKKLSYVDITTGELIQCQVFVSVLPYSGLIYCKAVHTQNTYDFADCINSMLKFYCGTSQTILCDNLKTAVTRPSKYEPVFTELCYQMGEHYNTCFSATRPYKPRDKAMVEKAVNIVYNHIYGPLRNDTFYSLKELNAAIQLKQQKLNDKNYKGSAYSRNQLFIENEKHLLTPLPCEAFKPKKVVQLTVQRNYHIQLSENHHYYSVPYTYTGKKVKVLYDNNIIEIYHSGSRIAVHQRNNLSKAYHTIGDHMPPNHQQAVIYKGWSKEDLLKEASIIGVHVLKVAEHILSSSFYPQQNFKACHGMIMLHKKYGIHRVDCACKRALYGTKFGYGTIRDILLAGLDKQPDLFDDTPLPDHDNIRGPEEYK